jgi:hypothetical protein
MADFPSLPFEMDAGVGMDSGGYLNAACGRNNFNNPD